MQVKKSNQTAAKQGNGESGVEEAKMDGKSESGLREISYSMSYTKARVMQGTVLTAQNKRERVGNSLNFLHKEIDWLWQILLTTIVKLRRGPNPFPQKSKWHLELSWEIGPRECY